MLSMPHHFYMISSFSSSPFTAAMARNTTLQKTIAFLFTEHWPMRSEFTGCKGQGLQHTSIISQTAALKKGIKELNATYAIKKWQSSMCILYSSAKSKRKSSVPRNSYPLFFQHGQNLVPEASQCTGICAHEHTKSLRREKELVCL